MSVGYCSELYEVEPEYDYGGEEDFLLGATQRAEMSLARDRVYERKLINAYANGEQMAELQQVEYPQAPKPLAVPAERRISTQPAQKLAPVEVPCPAKKITPTLLPAPTPLPVEAQPLSWQEEAGRKVREQMRGAKPKRAEQIVEGVLPQIALPLEGKPLEAVSPEEARDLLLYVKGTISFLRDWLKGKSIKGATRYAVEVLRELRRLEKDLAVAAKT